VPSMSSSIVKNLIQATTDCSKSCTVADSPNSCPCICKEKGRRTFGERSA
jgi:hypothetical protein